MWSEEPASHHHADRPVHGGCKENGSRNESDAEMVARGLDWAQALSCGVSESESSAESCTCGRPRGLAAESCALTPRDLARDIREHVTQQFVA